MLARIRIFLGFLTLTLGSGAIGAGYLPLVSPIQELPKEVGQVTWVNESLAGTSDGLFVREASKWRRLLRGREIGAVGEMPNHGWWAAGHGFVATSATPEAIIAADDEFTGGCFFRDSLFLSGTQGIWILQAKELTQVQRVSSAHRSRLFVLQDEVYLYANGSLSVWKSGNFVPSRAWQNHSFKDVLTVRETSDGGCLILAYEGFFELSAGNLKTLHERGFHDLKDAGAVGVYQGDHLAVMSSLLQGLRAVDANDKVLWELGVEELGGNPYSMIKTPAGFLVGTSSGAVRVFSESFYRLPLPGEYIVSVGKKVHLPSGAYDLRSGEFTAKAPFTESDPAFGRWGTVTLPGDNIVALSGSAVLALEKYQQGWLVLQEAFLSYLDASGKFLSRLPVKGADSLVVEDENAWIGSAAGLYRFDGRTLSPENTSGPVRVESGVNGPVFVSKDELCYPRKGEPQRLPGRILAVDGGYAAIQAGAELFVGKYAGRTWQPLDVPGLPAGLSHLHAEGDFLYAVSPHEVLRITLAGTEFLRLPPASYREVTVTQPNFSAQLPDPRPAPWPNPHFVVRANGESVPVVDGTYTIPRLPYGRTRVEVVASLGGLVSPSEIILLRPRPWWFDWPGALLLLALLAGLVSLLIRWRTHRLSRHARELERLVDERTRALNEALKARELFFSSISHEIRNPLNGVVGLCDMLNEAAVGARERLLVKTLKSCSDQLRRILDDVLDFSRIDRGELEFHPETFDLGPAVEGAARVVDPTLARVQLKVPENLWVEGDVGKLRQVVTNLVSNALKYGQPPMAKVDVVHQQDAGGYLAVEVRVTNTGPDLPPEEQESIFKGFHRGADAKRRRLPGSGIGLALSRRIMRAMPGDLTVASQGGLTTFTLKATLTPAAAPADDNAPPQAAARSSKALAIEDEHYNRLVLGYLLGQLGYEVDWAVDGAAALEAIRSDSYDLILTDYMLPDMDGVALARQILQRVTSPPPPIVMVTAYSTREKQDAAHAAGISGFITKPVTLKKLQAALLGLGYGLRGRRSLDVFRPSGRFDFAVFHRMNDGRVALGQYADQFEESFQALLGLIEQPEALRKAAHALRGIATVVHATSLAEQLGMLEGLADAKDRDQVARVLSAIEPMVHDLAESARHHVFSASDFGKTLG